MQRAIVGLILVAIGTVCGCGGSASAPSKFAAPPHGGNVVELPESRGFVELKADRGAAPKGSRKAPASSRILAYFYQADSTTAMSPAPTDVKVTLGDKIVSLTPQSADPGQFASEPGSYPDELRGQIEFQLDGKPVQVAFMFR